MGVWLNDDKFAVYPHYEKTVFIKKVLHAQSAMSSRCKQSVHVNEIVRRILNTSIRLDGDDQTCPVLTD